MADCRVSCKRRVRKVILFFRRTSVTLCHPLNSSPNIGEGDPKGGGVCFSFKLLPLMSNKCPRIESHILTAITTTTNAGRVVSWYISTRRSASIFVTRWQQCTKRTSRPLSASASFLTSPAHSPPPSAAASKRSLIGALKSKRPYSYYCYYSH